MSRRSSCASHHRAGMRRPDQTALDAGSVDAGTDVASDAPVGSCNANTDCRSDGYCDFHGRCALSSNRFGKCIFKPTTCPPQAQPAYVCGCDAQAYASECEAKSQGVDVNDRGGCAPPGKEFAPCGTQFCALPVLRRHRQRRHRSERPRPQDLRLCPPSVPVHDLYVFSRKFPVRRWQVRRGERPRHDDLPWRVTSSLRPMRSSTRLA